MDTSADTPFAWSGRVAFITGGASGIGLGIAKALAKRNVRIALSDVRAGALTAAADELKRSGADVLPIVLDVAKPADVQEAARTVDQHFGKVHFLFNNAGVGDTGRPFYEMPDEVFRWMMDVNLFGVFHGIKAFLPGMLRHGEGGHIVNTASMASFAVIKGWNMGAYSASKMAVLALSKDLRFCLEDRNIGVSALCPGAVITNLAMTSHELNPAPVDLSKVVIPAELRGHMSPEDAGEIVARAIARNDYLIVPNPESWPVVEAMQQEVREAFERALADAEAQKQ